MGMKRVSRNVVTLVTVLLLVLIAACAPTPGEVTPAPTPTPGGVTPTPAPTPEEITPPPSPEPTPIPSPVPETNFRLLISDDVNAIGDFESLVVTISSIGVHKGGEAGDWLEFPPATEKLDLVPLQEENAQEIWSGTLPDGQYTKVFIYVSDIDAVLETCACTHEKLPSQKLHINTLFNIPEDSPVSFIFDLSVIAAGSQQNDIKYILKPVVSQSGPNQKFIEVSPPEMKETPEEKGELEGEPEIEFQEELEGELALEIVEGNIAPGESVTLLVTLEGEPVAGAEVKVNDENMGQTDENGTISFTLPEDVTDFKVEAKLGAQKGELDIAVKR